MTAGRCKVIPNLYFSWSIYLTFTALLDTDWTAINANPGPFNQSQIDNDTYGFIVQRQVQFAMIVSGDVFHFDDNKSQDPQKTVIVSGYAKGGGNMMGEVLGKRPETFFSSEPLVSLAESYYFKNSTSMCTTILDDCFVTTLTERALDRLRSIISCSSTDIVSDEYHQKWDTGDVVQSKVQIRIPPSTIVTYHIQEGEKTHVKEKPQSKNAASQHSQKVEREDIFDFLTFFVKKRTPQKINKNKNLKRLPPWNGQWQHNCHWGFKPGSREQKSLRSNTFNVSQGEPWLKYHECLLDKEYDKDFCNKYLSYQCQRASVRIIKTERLSTELIGTLMKEFPNLYVVHMFRDPRGIVYANLKSNTIGSLTKRGGVEQYATSLCSRMDSDLEAGNKLAALYPKRFKLMLFEDFRLDMVTVVRPLFRFLGLPLATQDKNIVETLELKKSLAKYYRESGDDTPVDADKLQLDFETSLTKLHPFNWRREINSRTLGAIDRVCQSVYVKLGYNTYTTIKKLRDLQNWPSYGSGGVYPL